MKVVQLSISLLHVSTLSLILVNKISSAEKKCDTCDRNEDKKCVGGYLVLDEDSQICKLPTEEIKRSGWPDTKPIKSRYITSETVPTKTSEEWNNFCELNNKPSKSDRLQNFTTFRHPDICFKYIRCYDSRDKGASMNVSLVEKEVTCQRSSEFKNAGDYTGMLVYDPYYVDNPLFCRMPARPKGSSQAFECKDDTPPKVWGSGWNKTEVENPCSEFENRSNIREIIPHPNNCNQFLICKINADEDIRLFPNITFVEAGDCGTCEWDAWNCPEKLMYFDIERKECVFWSGLSSQRRTNCALSLPIGTPLKKPKKNPQGRHAFAEPK